MKLPHTEVKSQTGLSSLRVSCKRAVRAQSYQSDKQVRESYLKILLEGTHMRIKILLPFGLCLLRLHCWPTDAAKSTAEWKQSTLAGRKWSTKYGCVRCYDGGEGTRGDIKITRDEAMSATSWVKFVPSSSLLLLRYSLSLNSNISRGYSPRRHVNFYHLPWAWEQLIAWVEM